MLLVQPVRLTIMTVAYISIYQVFYCINSCLVPDLVFAKVVLPSTKAFHLSQFSLVKSQNSTNSFLELLSGPLLFGVNFKVFLWFSITVIIYLYIFISIKCVLPGNNHNGIIAARELERTMYGF